MNIKIGDVEIAYDRQGAGEPMLLVMGLGTPRMGWFHQFYALSEHYDVTCFDNRGVGETKIPSGQWTMQDMVSDTIGVADAMGHDRFHLVGCSMGGMISQEIALRFPDRLRSLTLVATTPAGPESVPMSAEFASIFMIADPHERQRKTVEMLFGEEFRRHNPEMMDLIVNFTMNSNSVTLIGAESDSPAASATMQGFMGQMAAVIGWFGEGGSAARLKDITVPTLVLHGGEDHLLPVGNGRLLARDISGARYREWPKAGHALNAEYPDEVNAEILDHARSAARV